MDINAINIGKEAGMVELLRVEGFQITLVWELAQVYTLHSRLRSINIISTEKPAYHGQVNNRSLNSQYGTCSLITNSSSFKTTSSSSSPIVLLCPSISTELPIVFLVSINSPCISPSFTGRST